MASNINTQEWVPFSLTLVKYPKGLLDERVILLVMIRHNFNKFFLHPDDPFGYLMALFSLAPVGITFAYLTLSLFRRDLQIVIDLIYPALLSKFLVNS